MNMLRKTTLKLALATWMAVFALGMTGSVRADESGCNINEGANCTAGCHWWSSGCACTNVDCDGGVCKWTNCNTDCCPNQCTGKACSAA